MFKPTRFSLQNIPCQIIELVYCAFCFICVFSLQSINVAFLGCQSFQDVLDIFKLAKIMLGEILSGDLNSMKISTLPFLYLWSAENVLVYSTFDSL